MRHRTRRHVRAILHAGRTAAHAALGRIPLLRHLLATTARVQIAYVKEGGEASVRIIEPGAVKLSKAGDWYVRAHDLLRGAGRTFRLDRITAITPA